MSRATKTPEYIEVAVDWLNHMAEIDPDFVVKIRESFYECKDEDFISDSPFQIRLDGNLSPLGLINGMINEEGKAIGLVFDDDDTFLRFEYIKIAYR